MCLAFPQYALMYVLMKSGLTKTWPSQGESREGVTVPHTLGPEWQMWGQDSPVPCQQVTSHSRGAEERVLLRPPHEEPKVSRHLVHFVSQ